MYFDIKFVLANKKGKNVNSLLKLNTTERWRWWWWWSIKKYKISKRTNNLIYCELSKLCFYFCFSCENKKEGKKINRKKDEKFRYFAFLVTWWLFGCYLEYEWEYCLIFTLVKNPNRSRFIFTFKPFHDSFSYDC